MSAVCVRLICAAIVPAIEAANAAIHALVNVCVGAYSSDRLSEINRLQLIGVYNLPIPRLAVDAVHLWA